MRKLVLLLALAACGDSRSPECETAVTNAKNCIETFCSGRDGKLCACVRQGKDVNLDCACTGSIEASFERALCEDQIPPETFQCDAATDAFAELNTSYSCAGADGGCEDDDDCGQTQVCAYGRCISSCERDYDCGVSAGRICEAGKCVEGCRSASLHCDYPGEECHMGKCRPASCSHDYQCQSRCVAGRCT